MFIKSKTKKGNKQRSSAVKAGSHLIAASLLLSLCQTAQAGAFLTYEQILGSLLYRDKNLSLNKNIACTSCHSLQAVKREKQKAVVFADFANVTTGTPVSKGSVLNTTGALNSPTAAYAAFSPTFHWNADDGEFVGGQFWNGRAKNLIEQAKGPFLNPAEMAMPSAWAVITRLKQNANYQKLFKLIYGVDLKEIPSVGTSGTEPASVKRAYDLVGKAIAQFESSAVFNKFTSKFDFVLTGVTSFTDIEAKGLDLFNGKAQCSACHLSDATISPDGDVLAPLFTDFTYDNLGLPRNISIPNNPEPNLGLGGRVDIAALDPKGDQIGKHKVPTLRNIALTPPYGHNGVFASLEQAVHFYNTRDTLGLVRDNQSVGFGVKGWPVPEVPQNVNADELGNLGLTPDEEAAIVAFLKTLTDGYPEWGKDKLVRPGTPSPFTYQLPLAQ